MKIVCDACSAKYSIADEKVKGKVFKIRCKKCSNIIVVRGNAGAAGAEEPAAAAPAGAFDQKETRVYDYGGYDGDPAGAPPGDEAVWHVVVDQEQVGPITVAEVQTRYAAGEIDGETYIWREGFSDWLPLTQVPDFASLVAGGTTTTAQPSSGQDAVASMFGAANYQDGDDGGTARSDPNDVFAAHAAKASEAADDDDGAGDLFGAKSASKSQGASDGLFGGAGSSSGKAAPAGGGIASMKGQRGENSVLFSLNNLAALASDSPKASASPSSSAASSSSSMGAAQMGGGEGSGLIDIRSMASAYLHPGQKAGAAKPGGNVGSMDDLPVFSTAAFSEPAVIIPSMGGMGMGSRGSNKMMYILVAAVGALALIAVVLVVVMLKKGTPAATTAAGTGTSADSDKPRGITPGDDTAAGGAGDGTGTGTGTGTGGGGGTGTQVAVTDPPVASDKPPVTTDKPMTTDKPTRPTSDRNDKPDRTKPTPDKPNKPAVEKPVTDKPAGGSCLDEVACLLADKPPACCSRYGKGGGGGGGGGGGSKPPAPNPNLPEDLTKSDISAGVGKVRGRVDGCAAKSSAKGTVKVSVKVSPGGSVSSVTVKETPDPGLGSCVAAAMQKATFAKTQTGGTFSYPFKF